MLRQIGVAGFEDTSTGLYNRAGFESAAQQYFRTSSASPKVLVIVARIDGATDVTMRQFSEALRSASREFQALPPPCLARVGAEEFAIMVAEDSPARLTRFMERTEAQGPVVWGFATYDAEYPSSPASLIERARQQAESITAART